MLVNITVNSWQTASLFVKTISLPMPGPELHAYNQSAQDLFPHPIKRERKIGTESQEGVAAGTGAPLTVNSLAFGTANLWHWWWRVVLGHHRYREQLYIVNMWQHCLWG